MTPSTVPELSRLRQDIYELGLTQDTYLWSNISWEEMKKYLLSTDRALTKKRNYHIEVCLSDSASLGGWEEHSSRLLECFLGS